MINTDGGDMGIEPGFEAFDKPDAHGNIGVFRIRGTQLHSDYSVPERAVELLKRAGWLFYGWQLGWGPWFPICTRHNVEMFTGETVAYMLVPGPDWKPMTFSDPLADQFQLPGIIDRE